MEQGTYSGKSPTMFWDTIQTGSTIYDTFNVYIFNNKLQTSLDTARSAKQFMSRWLISLFRGVDLDPGLESSLWPRAFGRTPSTGRWSAKSQCLVASVTSFCW